MGISVNEMKVHVAGKHQRWSEVSFLTATLTCATDLPGEAPASVIQAQAKQAFDAAES